MKPPSENHDLIRWLDGEMNAAERASFEERLAQDDALNSEALEMKALGADIRAHLPREMTVPHADFFNSQIQVRIAQMEARDPGAQAAPWLSSLIGWLRQPWFAVAGAAAVAVAAFLMSGAGVNVADSQILSSYTPSAHVQARTFHDSDAQATVLMLDGLDAVPADRKVSGLNVHHSQTETEIAATSLYDASGSRLLTISRDTSGNPYFWKNSPRG